MQVKRATISAKQFKLIMIGDSMVGKTSIIQRFIDDHFADNNNTSPTLAWDFKVKTIDIPRVGGQGIETVRLYVWDTAGQERFRHIARMYYKDVCGVLLCFDLTDQESFKNLQFWISDLSRHAPENVQKILIGNKSDLGDRQVSQEQAVKFALDNNMPYLEASAKTNTNPQIYNYWLVTCLSKVNIVEAFQTLASNINTQQQASPGDMRLGMDQQIKLSADDDIVYTGSTQQERISERMSRKKKSKKKNNGCC